MFEMTNVEDAVTFVVDNSAGLMCVYSVSQLVLMLIHYSYFS